MSLFRLYALMLAKPPVRSELVFVVVILVVPASFVNAHFQLS
jgi:hypothetical protein